MTHSCDTMTMPFAFFFLLSFSWFILSRLLMPCARAQPRQRNTRRHTAQHHTAGTRSQRHTRSSAASRGRRATGTRRLRALSTLLSLPGSASTL
eukprot:scaffold30377_cov36-Phaeocystis_antarctica.AAC.1